MSRPFDADFATIRRLAPGGATVREDGHRPDADFLQGGGELGALIRSKDWSATPIGPPDGWPQSLRTTVSLCLASNFPINIIWGPQHTQIYNDGYRACCGDAHPHALGESYRETWASAWPVIGESFERAWDGETMFLENQRMFLRRLNGRLEETFFTFSHSPIRDESGGIGGLFHPVTETTATMLSERRTRALRDLAASLALATDEDDVADRVVEVLTPFDADLPFLLYYRMDDDEGRFRLVAQRGVAEGVGAAPDGMADAARAWPFAQAPERSSVLQVDDLHAVFRGAPCGPYEEAPTTAFVLPIHVPAAERQRAVVVAGVSSRLPMTESYRSFYPLLGVTIATAVGSVRAREDARRRAEALAEIDRAKTDFFTNLSHEFRTPLTLMLGPVDDLLATSDSGRSPAEQAQLEMVHRNSLRLLKLVNNLLDFSRVEAGRLNAQFQATDLSTLTAGLASCFRSACERAGLALLVDCLPLGQPVYVDRDMWEKVVLNLLSNAFKFTANGEIEVGLRADGGHAELVVRDTGVGIAPDQLPRLFERFHRIAGTEARTHEGSGIGLALVQELVAFHGGQVTVDSVPGEGSRFIVRIPFGDGHLDPGQVAADTGLAPTVTGSAAFVEEALRWLPNGAAPGPLTGTVVDLPVEAAANEGAPSARRRVLLAEDNADMGDYVARLLAPRFEVQLVPDGAAALEAARRCLPDLVLADVMMPRLDGMGLLDALRSDPATAQVPVILLSARAGEDSRVDGVRAGADDYLVKPFSARELLARVEMHVKMACMRRAASDALRESEQRFRMIAQLVPAILWITDARGRVEYLNPWGYSYTGTTEPPAVVARLVAGHVHPDDIGATTAALGQSCRTGQVFRAEHRVRSAKGEYRWFLSCAEPHRDPDTGQVIRWFGASTDINEQRMAQALLELRVGERTRELAAAGELRRQLLARLEVLREEERRRVARELHDSLGQHLTALALAVARLDDGVRAVSLGEGLCEVRQLIDLADRELDHLVFQLRPMALGDCDLGEAISSHVASWSGLTGTPVHLLLRGLQQGRLAGPVEVAVFRTVQEALNNVAKHAKARSVTLFIKRGRQHLMASVEDDGIGFDSEARMNGSASPGRRAWGLLGMKERIEALGGHFTIESSAGAGTSLLIRLPCLLQTAER